MTTPESPGEVEAIRKRYREMDEYQLAELHERTGDLTDGARIALAEVMAEKNVDLAKLRQQQLDDDREIRERARIQEERGEVRDARWMKVLWIASISIVVLSFWMRPERAWATFVATLTQVVVLSAIFYGASRLRRYLRQRRK